MEKRRWWKYCQKPCKSQKRFIYNTFVLKLYFCLIPGEKKYEGENLSISRVSRAQMGAYLCIASNDVPPTVSKRISLNVNCNYHLFHCFKQFRNYCLFYSCSRNSCSQPITWISVWCQGCCRVSRNCVKMMHISWKYIFGISWLLFCIFASFWTFLQLRHIQTQLIIGWSTRQKCYLTSKSDSF